MAKGELLIPDARIEKEILMIRGHKVMLGNALAEMYGVPTRVLNQAVRGKTKGTQLFVYPFGARGLHACSMKKSCVPFCRPSPFVAATPRQDDPPDCAR